tara:strand:- start:299 stop:562 length:264 start_codon:yes stop_codon:yes gene_type:complete
MRKAIEDREFVIQITYSAQDLNEISKWYINNAMPPIYKNYDLENEEIAGMIEEEAVKTLMKLGSHKIMDEHLQQNIVVFTSEIDEEE